VVEHVVWSWPDSEVAERPDDVRFLGIEGVELLVSMDIEVAHSVVLGPAGGRGSRNVPRTKARRNA